MRFLVLVALVCATVSVSRGSLIDPPRTFNPVTENGMSVGYTLGTDSTVNGIVIYYSGAIYTGDFYKDSSTALHTGVAVGQRCVKDGVLYEYFSGVDAHTTLDSLLQDDPPSLASPIKGPTTTQRIGCKVPGMANDVGYDDFARGVTWKDFIKGPTVYEDSTCTGNIAAQIFVRNGSSITVDVMGKTYTVAYPFTHLNSGIACTVYSSDSRLFWKNPTNTSAYSLQRHMEAFGTMPMPGRISTKWNWLAITFVAFTGVYWLLTVVVATFGPIKRPSKVLYKP